MSGAGKVAEQPRRGQLRNLQCLEVLSYAAVLLALASNIILYVSGNTDGRVDKAYGRLLEVPSENWAALILTILFEVRPEFTAAQPHYPFRVRLESPKRSGILQNTDTFAMLVHGR
ncbi:hypothetical protein DFJ77DRAFT_443105 [Powellomyces hirtus]|nr:hypothetical protein DFJ77DRAFT_443105 [Powellomyces hirtus]